MRCANARTGDISENESRVLNWQPFRETLEFFADQLMRPVVLGGGCVRDVWIEGPHLIKDYDVFVLGVKEEEIPDLDARLSNAMHHLMEHNVHKLEDGGKTACIDYPNRKFHLPKANLKLPWIPDDKLTQLMYTPSENMQDLVDQFDWHVCSFGFDGQTVISTGVGDFEKQQLTLNPGNALRSPRSTLRRGFRLEDKFRGTTHRLRLPNEMILALAAMLVLDGEGKKDLT